MMLKLAKLTWPFCAFTESMDHRSSEDSQCMSSLSCSVTSLTAFQIRSSMREATKRGERGIWIKADDSMSKMKRQLCIQAMQRRTCCCRTSDRLLTTHSSMSCGRQRLTKNDTTASAVCCTCITSDSLALIPYPVKYTSIARNLETTCQIQQHHQASKNQQT